MIAGSEYRWWPQFIAAGEKLGIRIEEEEEKARQQQQQMMDKQFRRRQVIIGMRDPGFGHISHLGSPAPASRILELRISAKEEPDQNTNRSSSILLLWISVAVVHAAQAPANDVSARVFNSADVTVPDMKRVCTGHRSPSIQSDGTRPILHETATNSGRFKAPVAGKYYIFANITWGVHFGYPVSGDCGYS